MAIGSKGNGGSYWDGLLDEIRISNVARSAEWISAQQRSLSDSLITYQTGSSNTPPTVSITAPANGAILATPASLAITATATDDGNVTQVSFYADGSLLGTDGAAPFSIGWNNPPAGGHTLTAIATDDGNLNTGSTPVGITLTAPTVNQAPSVNAGSDKAAAVGATVDILAIVNDDGLPSPPSVTGVQWTQQSGPGTVTWPLGDSTQSHTHVLFPVAGTYVLRLTASDSALTNFDEVTVIVTELPNVVPTASFTVTPTNGTVPLTVAVDASASSDSDGTITSYAWNFGDGATSSGTSTTASHQYTVAGNYTITLTITDNNAATASTTRAVAATTNLWNQIRSLKSGKK